MLPCVSALWSRNSSFQSASAVTSRKPQTENWVRKRKISRLWCAATCRTMTVICFKRLLWQENDHSTVSRHHCWRRFGVTQLICGFHSLCILFLLRSVVGVYDAEIRARCVSVKLLQDLYKYFWLILFITLGSCLSFLLIEGSHIVLWRMTASPVFV